LAHKVVFTGKIDEYFDFEYGKLDYRSLEFEHKTLDIPNYQGNAVVNYTEAEVPYTRILEHKHFEFGKQDKTVVTKEYPKEWQEGDEPYYPVNDDKNSSTYLKYKKLAENTENVIFGGRLAEYKYYDMHQVIASALSKVKKVEKE
ncbi:MAG: UDP-galactopyranose mutase, partial [Flavobacteriaceae bacterium]|nr:UDP-galactopyranose mutase [Flavobacteriaceae bacterium]